MVSVRPVASRTRSALIGPLGDATYLYPLRGLGFFLSNPYFFPLFKSRLIPVIFLSILIYTLLFFFAYLPQVAFLAIYNLPQTAFINGVFLVLSEGTAIVSLLFEIFYVDKTLAHVFDATLIASGYEDVVAHLRHVYPTEELHPDGRIVTRTPVQRLGAPHRHGVKEVYYPFSLRQTFEFIILLPVNLIPYIGPALFIFGTGYRAGMMQHHRYYAFRGFDKKQQNRYFHQRKLRYTWFGVVQLTLQLVPVLSMFFLLTTAAGSAIFATELERRHRLAEEVTHEEEQ